MDDISVLKRFRQTLYELLPKRGDATLDLIDALSSFHQAKSVTELSLSPFFRRKYNSITKIIRHFLVQKNPKKKGNKKGTVGSTTQTAENQLSQLIRSVSEPIRTRNFFCLVLIQHHAYVLIQTP